jgi:hypothetical protein
MPTNEAYRVVPSAKDGLMYARSYLAGGGRGEKTGSDGNGRGVHTFGTSGRGTLTTTARKNQNGIKKRKRRPSTG